MPVRVRGRYFAHHQQCRKELSDPNQATVQVQRYKCVRCGRSFRVHPTGVGRQVKVVSADATYVVCHGHRVTVAVALDAPAGMDEFEWDEAKP